MPDMGDLGGEEDDEVDGDEEADDSEMPGLEEDGAEGGCSTRYETKEEFHAADQQCCREVVGE